MPEPEAQRATVEIRACTFASYQLNALVILDGCRVCVTGKDGNNSVGLKQGQQLVGHRQAVDRIVLDHKDRTVLITGSGQCLSEPEIMCF